MKSIFEAVLPIIVITAVLWFILKPAKGMIELSEKAVKKMKKDKEL